MYLTLCIAISLVTVAIVAIPLWFFPAQTLQASATENSPEKLERIKKAVLRRYVEEEAIHSSSGMAGVVWEQRKSFLINRYLDAARRLDYLAFLDSHGDKAKEADHGKS